jgi:hypothetical protein
MVTRPYLLFLLTLKHKTMKINIKDAEQFTPIVIELTIETPEELDELYGRLNVPTETVESDSFTRTELPSSLFYNAWSKVDDICRKRLSR